MKKIAAVVVLYNPGQDSVENIFSYYKQVEAVYIFDNSEKKNSIVEKINTLGSIKIVSNEGNAGISIALNTAASIAIKEGYKYLLTMDQDSRIPDNYVAELLKEFDNKQNVGIVSSFIVHKKNPKKAQHNRVEDVATLITSGSIINLAAHKKIGGFLEKLFIDYVDNEYCLRMRPLDLWYKAQFGNNLS